jgi:DNA-directed RNA polymerase subunit beta'
VPSQDIVLGLYYLSLMNEGEPGEGMAFGEHLEVTSRAEAKAVTLHAKIKGRGSQSIDADGNEVTKIYVTTPGRMLLGELLPKQPGQVFPSNWSTKLLTKKAISGLIDAVYRNCGQKETVIFCDRIMALGFSTRSRPASRSARTTWSCPTPSRRSWRDRGARPRVRAAVQRRSDHPA